MVVFRCTATTTTDDASVLLDELSTVRYIVGSSMMRMLRDVTLINDCGLTVATVDMFGCRILI